MLVRASSGSGGGGGTPTVLHNAKDIPSIAKGATYDTGISANNCIIEFKAGSAFSANGIIENGVLTSPYIAGQPNSYIELSIISGTGNIGIKNVYTYNNATDANALLFVYGN